MVPATRINDTKEIIQTFAKAVQDKDFDLITSLLADDGGFELLDEKLDITSESKAAYMNWIKAVLSDTTITKIEYDTCILCAMGNPVVLFNDGQFPKVKKDHSRKSMNALMLDIADGKIKEIKFCNFLAGRENKFQFECNGVEIQKLIETTGISVDDAISIVLAKNGY